MASLEICANSINSAIAAQDGGAIRIEFCDNLKEGGTTPSAGQITLARKLLQIKLYVLIRPRSGDFLYSDIEFEAMQEDIKYCIQTGCDGVVIGILKADGTIDKERNKILIDLAKQAGLGVTFHRAFDVCADQYQALEDIIELGCERILTSGGKISAMEGSATLAHLVEKAAGRISIMAGAGVNEHNAADLIHYTSVQEVHSSARSMVASKMTYQNDHISMGDPMHDEYSYDQTDVERVKELVRLINT